MSNPNNLSISPISNNERNNIGRRTFLRLAAGACLALTLDGCSGGFGGLGGSQYDQLGPFPSDETFNQRLQRLHAKVGDEETLDVESLTADPKEKDIALVNPDMPQFQENAQGFKAIVKDDMGGKKPAELFVPNGLMPNEIPAGPQYIDVTYTDTVQNKLVPVAQNGLPSST